MEAAKAVLTDRGLVESPRWHNGQLWFADWTAGENLTVDDSGLVEVRARAPAPPLSLDLEADGMIHRSKLVGRDDQSGYFESHDEPD